MEKSFGQSWIAENLNGSHKQWLYLSWLMESKSEPNKADVMRCLKELGLCFEEEYVVSITPHLSRSSLFQIQMCLLMTNISDEIYLEFVLPWKAQKLGWIDLELEFGLIE